MVAFIGGIGSQEILLVLAIALVIFGPKKIPEIARNISKIVIKVRQANRQFQREIFSNLDPEEILRNEQKKSGPGRPEPDEYYAKVLSSEEDETETEPPKADPPG
jgi:Tat protein translocase TatB subunit